MEPISLHECRHSYAAYMIAAGVNTKALSTYMGHTSITITLDRYGHLLPGNEHEAAALLDSYLTNGSAGAATTVVDSRTPANKGGRTRSPTGEQTTWRVGWIHGPKCPSDARVKTAGGLRVNAKSSIEHSVDASGHLRRMIVVVRVQRTP